MARLDLRKKLEILADAAKYDASCASSGTSKRSSVGGKGVGSTEGMGICHAYTPDGRCVSLLKILLTNFCIFDCAYCINRTSSNVPRARFSVQEVVDLTLNFYRRNYIEGLFLSSGIVQSGNHTMEEMIRVARSLREDHDFRGYIHLKLIPEADPALVEQAGLYADRLSANVELPRDEALARLAPQKDAGVIKKAMGQVRLKVDEARGSKTDRIKPPRFAPAGQSTQLIIGADGAPDAEILDRSSSLYGGYGLRRVYYSAFSPIPDSSSALPPSKPPLLREHRLYQADWLMRFYGFTAPEISSASPDGMLDLAVDPKLAWALANRDQFPVDVNLAGREILLRVPGLGVKSVNRMISVRRYRTLRLEDIQRLTRGIDKVRPFITALDWTPGGLTDAVDLKARLAPPAHAGAVEPVLMRTVRLTSETDFAAWRETARGLVLAGEGPAAVRFRVGTDQGSLFDAAPRAQPAPPTALLSVPRAFLDLGAEVVLHRSEDRFDLLYRLLWRLQSERDLIKVTSDRDVADALERAKNVSRASHKMKAFVRFRQAEDEAGERWIAWFEPAHRVLEKTAPFFERRFTTMRWTILTPDGTADWVPASAGMTTGQLTFGPPATRDMAPQEDEIEEFWKTYYASTFNPARLKTKTMQGEMPKRYWANLPEAALIPELVARAEVREREMVAAPATPANPKLVRAVAPVVDRAAPDASPPQTLAVLERAVQGCRRCPLWRDATQGVCGRGPARADLMIVGEQPGDQEDLSGEPFVGPAGQVLDAAMAEAEVDRTHAFVTNAVKHFKHEPRGKRRLHKTPDAGEISACRWWLDAERAIVKPKLILTLGATAAFGVLGRKVAVTKERGRPIALEDGSSVLLTVHPSYLLRIPDRAAAAAERARFVEDLRAARALL